MIWTGIAGLSGASSIALGAIGAHALKSKTEAMRETWRIGSTYHLIHSCVLALAAVSFVGRKRNIVCGLFTAGIVFFSGSCYTVVIMDQRNPYSKPAPIGGFLLMGGWLALGFL
jgi:uncharacterized membrane protein YgdD (TMEM256/DUF423 family)